ncbi:MAG TPA: PPOX class F420-dependent oxidoreductase [Acidimicrobiales bacterium]|jgi:PPOX class probable F420-dependent enzyme|nr:PPOX class F420-dependent oxidoreductase [Acidimicrobiales bacterium]
MTDDDLLWPLIADGQQGVLATLHADGRPHLTNVLYVVDKVSRLLRISTTADRRKARNVARDPKAALHVAGENFWAYAVADGRATLSDVATHPSDETVMELLAVHSAFYGPPDDPDEFSAEMIANRRLVIRLQVDRIYGLVAAGGRRPAPSTPADSD